MITNDLPKNMDEYLRREDELDKVKFCSLKRYARTARNFNWPLLWLLVLGGIEMGLAVYGALHLIGVVR